MDRRSIILKTMSCQCVKFFNFFQKPSVYAIVSVGDGREGQQDRRLQQQKTPADLDGGENPEWNHVIRFDFDDGEFQHLFLQFDIMAQGNLLLFGDKLIGRAYVPITDLMAGKISDALRHVSYQVQSPEAAETGESIGSADGFSFGRSLLSDASVPTASYYYHHIQPPMGLGICYFPTTPPAAAFYSPVDWAAYSPVLYGSYSSMPVASGVGGFYAPPAPMPASHGAYYQPTACGYGCPLPQESCGCCKETRNFEMDGYQ